MGVSAELGTEQCLLCQGCSAEPWFAPVSSNPKVRSVPTRPPPQDRASVLSFCWGSHSHWSLGCVDTTPAPPQASLRSAVPELKLLPSPIIKAWSHSQESQPPLAAQVTTSKT